MRQWDVFVNPSPRMRDSLPYLVLVQSDLLASLDTRWMAPLARQVMPSLALPRTPSRLMPSFVIQGETCQLVPQETGPILARSLGPAIQNLRDDSHRIVDALDTVISGV